MHMHPAFAASMALDQRGGVNDLQLVSVLGDAHLVGSDNRHLRKRSPGRLPALGTTADMVVQTITADLDHDRIFGAMAGQCGTGKAGRAGFDTVVDGGVNGNLGQNGLPDVIRSA